MSFFQPLFVLITLGCKLELRIQSVTKHQNLFKNLVQTPQDQLVSLLVEICPVFIINRNTTILFICTCRPKWLVLFVIILTFIKRSCLFRWYAELKYNLDTVSGIQTGLNDKQTPFLWQWDDGSSYNWNQWDVGIEPSAETTKHCVALVNNANNEYVWQRQNCNSTAAVICQLRVPPISTGTTYCTWLPAWL